ncbi:histidinol-phosphate transaminase [Litoreibacter albidus]|uniref:Histidinol-phosphate aminotransferase n=1 Tax=Litoreibacter albidus TaxID=670155 RepID=A0A1H2QTE6_9RHOB|nr:histidinol-phosphate transaminase [Litoreibacter albidus]SDW10421.1 histidinol-phosphate aminotransferase [Litoreibacter albidus]
MTITPQPGIMDIKLYQSGASKIDGVTDVVKLSSNENPHGPSKRALDAFRQAAGELHLYPSTDHADLRHAISEVQGMDPARITCGVGSDEIISFLCYAYAGPGDEVLYTEHGFSMYRISALAAGATPVEVAETDRHTDVDNLLAGVTDNTKLVFIANPNNPTGTMIGEAEVARLADGLPEGCLLVLDGAYAEFVEGFDAGKAIIDARENVFMTRTFSKIYGLGGLRIGYGYGPQEIIDTLNRVRGPFNLGVPALKAAEMAMRDVGYTEWCRKENARMRGWMTEQLLAMGIAVDPSEANFVLARFEDQAKAEAVDAHLKSKGLIVRLVAGYNLPDCLRITVGTEDACKRVIAAIKETL